MFGFKNEMPNLNLVEYQDSLVFLGVIHQRIIK